MKDLIIFGIVCLLFVCGIFAGFGYATGVCAGEKTRDDEYWNGYEDGWRDGNKNNTS